MSAKMLKLVDKLDSVAVDQEEIKDEQREIRLTLSSIAVSQVGIQGSLTSLAETMKTLTGLVSILVKGLIPVTLVALVCALVAMGVKFTEITDFARDLRKSSISPEVKNVSFDEQR